MIVLPKLLALVVLDVITHVVRVSGLVVAVRADRESGLDTHRYGIQTARTDFAGELGEPLSVDLLNDLNVLVIPGLDIASGNDSTPGARGVKVVVVHKDWLAQESPVALL